METTTGPKKKLDETDKLQAELDKSFGTSEEASRQKNFQFLKDIEDEKAAIAKEKSEKKKK